MRNELTDRLQAVIDTFEQESKKIRLASAVVGDGAFNNGYSAGVAETYAACAEALKRLMPKPEPVTAEVLFNRIRAYSDIQCSGPGMAALDELLILVKRKEEP